MGEEIGYTVHLSPTQLKVVYTALKTMYDGFGHDEPEVREAIRAVLEKLPDEHSIRAITI